MLLTFYFVFVSAPFGMNPVSESDKITNELRVKYMTCCIEFDVDYVNFV